MKIVVVGGTGLIGSKLVSKLAMLNHTVIAYAPSLGINTLTGFGLNHALQGTDVVVDVSNSPVVYRWSRTHAGQRVYAR